MGPTVLSEALQGLAPPTDPNLLVGFETADDAAVYRLTNEIAMINTVDFITPPVDDPYWFGQISAANSISDIYSMGGRPLTALNVVMFPAKHLDMGMLKEILHGGHDKVVEAGACLVGGHTVDDEEPKYGLCVSGVVHPDRIITNAGGKPGDALILTKPLGSGVLFNAVRSGKLPFRDLERDTLPSLAALNGTAMETALKFDLHAATDITGFGLSGHSLEMALSSGSQVILYYDKLPFYNDALRMYQKGETTGSNKPNQKLVQGKLQIRRSLSSPQEQLLYDPQTSGGLLLAVPAAQAPELIAALNASGLETAVQVGEVLEGPYGIVVT
ncbi:MAG: selenide, water dikinase SelD [Deltaproteobacteria bacterium]|nr:selenide, water dikinase SelD [Deltaproteobacteria bacterium]